MTHDRLFEILEQAGVRAEVPTPAASSTFSVRIEGGDADLPPDDVGDVLEVAGLALGIVYLNAAGKETRRRITVRSVSSRGEVQQLYAYCHEREALRQFRVDRIKELLVLATGEVIEDPKAFFDGLSGRDPTAEALSGVRHALQILTFLARCDGHFHPAELSEIMEFVIFSSPNPSAVDEARVRTYVSALYPDKASYFRSLRAVRFSGADQMKRVVRAIKLVLDADGILDDAEFQWALEGQSELPCN
ncbi:MAG: WYL domain-containing protein [Solirubrobacterales bacterium]